MNSTHEPDASVALDALPTGVLSKLVMDLDAISLAQLQCCSTRLREFLRDEHLWEGAALRLRLALTSTYRRAIQDVLQQARAYNAHNWMDGMYFATKDRSTEASQRVQFSSLLIAGADVKRKVVTFWTDGQAMVMMDSQGTPLLSLLPPHTRATRWSESQAITAAHAEHFLQDFTSLRHFIVQPHASALEGWPPQLLHAFEGPLPSSGSTLCLPMVPHDATSANMARSFLPCLTSRLLSTLQYLDLSGQALSDVQLATLVDAAVDLVTLRVARTAFGSVCCMALGTRGTRLASLDLSHCQHLSQSPSSTLPNALSRLPMLTRICFQGNSVKQLFPKGASTPPTYLSSLCSLDLSSCSDLSTGHMACILAGCANLKELTVADCKSLAEAEAGEGAVSLWPYLASLSSLPSLRSLSLGWGFNSLSIASLCCSSPFLTSLRLGLGCSFNTSDETVVKVARSCVHLQAVSLNFSVVSDEGVRALLSHCPKLQSLHLLHCTGPFTNNMLQGVECTGRWGLADLQIVGGCVTLCDQSLMRFIGQRTPLLTTLALVGIRGLTNRTLGLLHFHAPTLQHLRLEECFTSFTTTATTTASTSTFTSSKAALAEPPSNGLKKLSIHNTTGPSNRESQEMEAGSLDGRGGEAHYQGSPSSSEAFSKGDALRGQSGGARGESKGSGGGDAPACTGSERANTHPGLPRGNGSLELALDFPVLMALMKKCRQLRSLRLRHACRVPEDAVLLLTSHCPLLSSLMLDQCDLQAGGLQLQHDAHGALQQVQVCKCKQCPVSQGRLHKEVMVHVLAEDRSVPLKVFKHLG